MKTNYYTVYEPSDNLIPMALISFADKRQAEAHKDMLNRHDGNRYVVALSEIVLFAEVERVDCNGVGDNDGFFEFNR